MYMTILLQPFNETFIKLDLDKNIVYYNGKETNLSAVDYLNRFIPIIKKWDTFYSNPNIIDGASYKVEFFDGVNTAVYKGINKFPENYNNFLEIVKEIKQNA